MPVIQSNVYVKTLADLIEETRAHLIGNAQDQLNTLSGPVDALATSIPVTYPTSLVSDGVRIDVETETMYVWNVGTGSFAVRRGDSGSVALPHAEGALVRLDPRWTGFRIQNAINETILSLNSNGLYQMKFAPPIPFVSCTSTYQLPADCDEIYSVTRKNTWGRQMVSGWRLDHDPISPTGRYLYLSGWDLCYGDTLLVTYKAPPQTLLYPADLASEISGLPESALDIIPMGAALRLAAGQAIQRTDYDAIADTAGSDAARVNDFLVAGNALRQMYRERISEEKKALRRRWPPGRTPSF